MAGQRSWGHLFTLMKVLFCKTYSDRKNFSDVFFLTIKSLSGKWQLYYLRKVATLTCSFISVKRPFQCILYIKRHILLFSDDYFADSSLLQCLLDHMMTVGENRVSILKEKRENYSTSDTQISFN